MRSYTTLLLVLLAIAFAFPAVVVVAEHVQRPLWPYFRAAVGIAYVLSVALILLPSAALLRGARWKHALVAAPVALAILVGFGRVNKPWPPSSAKRSVLQAQGLGLVQQLEAFRAARSARSRQRPASQPASMHGAPAE